MNYCYRCNHVWKQKSKIIASAVCPRCHSMWWNYIRVSRYEYPVGTKEMLQGYFYVHVSTETSRAKQSAALEGRSHTPEHIEKVRQANSTPESRLLHRRSRLGKKASESTRAKLRLLKAGNQNMLGKHHSEETKRKMSEARKGIKYSKETKAKIGAYWIGKVDGDKNPAWKGGISFFPYCPKFTKEFKERVRKFFGYICVECGKHQNLFKQKLDIHHVNFDKMVCCDDTKPLFVPLCRSCHSKTNHASDHFEQKFTDLILEQYGGNCYVEKT